MSMRGVSFVGACFITSCFIALLPFFSDGKSSWLLSDTMLYADTLIYWEPEQRLTYDSIPQLHCQVWAYDSFVHILVNYDFPSMYLRSSDYGQTWSDTIRLNIDICTGLQTLTQQDSMIYFTWSEYRDGPPFNGARLDTQYAFFRLSNDFGMSLDTLIFLGKGVRASIDAKADSIFITPIVGAPPPTTGSYLIWSYNGGSNWSTYYPVSDSTDEPNIIYRNGILHFAGSRDYKIIYTRSTDLGNSWSTPTVITAPNTVLPKRPVLALGPVENAYIAWTDNKYSGMMQFDDVLFRKSTDDGLTWGSEQRLTADSHCDAGGSLDMVSQDSMLCIVWNFNGLGYPTPCSLFFLASMDCSESWRQREVIKGGAGFGMHDANVATTQNYVYVVWEDNEDSSYTYGGDLRIRRGSFAPVGTNERGRMSRYAANIYPNPFTQEIQIRFRMHDTGYKINEKEVDNRQKLLADIKMYDALGKEVECVVKSETKNGKIGEVVKIDTKDLACGVYFVQLKAGCSSTINKVIKIK